MAKTRQPVVGKNKVSIRVLFSESDYQSLVELADIERTDISSIVRRAVALQYSLPPNDKTTENQAGTANNQQS
jgi:hypothetical protein